MKQTEGHEDTIQEKGVCFYSLFGINCKILWKKEWVENEIKLLFSPHPYTKSFSINKSLHFELQFIASETPANIPYTAQKLLIYHGVSIYKDDQNIYLTDGFSLFQVQPQAEIGFFTLHYSFREKSSFSKNNFFLAGIIYILSSQGIFDLHAAGLVRNRTGFLLLGSSGSGKTSITLSLVRQGWQYVSDDALLLKSSKSGIEALTFRKNFLLDTTLAAHFPEISPYLYKTSNGDINKRFLDVDLVYPDLYCPNTLPKVLIFTHIAPLPVSKLTRVGKIPALIELTKQSASIFLNRQNAQTQFDILKQLVFQTVNYQLFAGRDLHEAPEKISEVLSDVIY